MMGWRVLWKCFVACLLMESSQQPTWPQLRQRRRWTQGSPLFRHSSQPSALGVTVLIVDKCLHVVCLRDSAMAFLSEERERRNSPNMECELPGCNPREAA